MSELDDLLDVEKWIAGRNSPLRSAEDLGWRWTVDADILSATRAFNDAGMVGDIFDTKIAGVLSVWLGVPPDAGNIKHFIDSWTIEHAQNLDKPNDKDRQLVADMKATEAMIFRYSACMVQAFNMPFLKDPAFKAQQKFLQISLRRLKKIHDGTKSETAKRAIEDAGDAMLFELFTIEKIRSYTSHFENSFSRKPPQIRVAIALFLLKPFDEVARHFKTSPIQKGVVELVRRVQAALDVEQYDAANARKIQNLIPENIDFSSWGTILDESFEKWLARKQAEASSSGQST